MQRALENQSEYERAKKAYQQALTGKNKTLNTPAFSKLILISAKEGNLDQLRLLLNEEESKFENKISDFWKSPLHIQVGSCVDLAYLAFYLEKTKDALSLCEYAHKITSRERYEPRSLQGLSEDILISTLYWSLGQNLGELIEKEKKTKAVERMGEVAKSLKHKPFDSDNVRLILFYLEPRKVSEFMESGCEEVNLNKLSQELLGQRQMLSNAIAQTKPQ